MHGRVCATNANWNSYYSFTPVSRTRISIHCHFCRCSCYCTHPYAHGPANWINFHLCVANETSFVLSFWFAFSRICNLFVLLRSAILQIQTPNDEKEKKVNKSEAHYLDLCFVLNMHRMVCVDRGCAREQCKFVVQNFARWKRKNEYSCRWTKNAIFFYIARAPRLCVSWYFRTMYANAPHSRVANEFTCSFYLLEA